MLRNIPLFILDCLCFPVTILRLALIYAYGSRYNITGFTSLDVMMHARNPYFNQSSGSFGSDKDNEESSLATVDDMDEDYRITIRNDSRLYPMEISEISSKVQNDASTRMTKEIINIRNDITQKIIDDLELVMNQHLEKLSVIDTDVTNNIKDDIQKEFEKLETHIKKYQRNKKVNNDYEIDYDEYDNYDNSIDYENYENYEDQDKDVNINNNNTDNTKSKKSRVVDNEINNNNNSNSFNANSFNDNTMDDEIDSIDELLENVKGRNRNSSIFSNSKNKNDLSVMEVLDSILD